MVSAPQPGFLVRCREQNIDFLTAEEADLIAGEALTRYCQHSLNLSRMAWQLERHVTKERMNRGEAQIATANGYTSVFFQIFQESHDQRCVDLLEC